MADNEALRRADALEQYAIDANSGDPRIVEAVAKLRRLSAVEAERDALLAACQRALAEAVADDQDGWYAALRAALAQAEPVQRKPLTEDEIWGLAANCLNSVAGQLQFARAIERAHGIGKESGDER